MKATGNTASNKVFLKNFPSDVPLLNAKCLPEEREKFIIEKYKEKRWC